MTDKNQGSSKEKVSGLCYRCVFKKATHEIGSGPMSRWLCCECLDVERAAHEPLPRYLCHVAGCPGNHLSKWDLCPAQPPPAEWLDSREFYEVMQAYRHAYVVDPAYVVERFEAVKSFIRSALTKGAGP